MTSCDHIQHQFVDYFSGELSQSAREHLEAHLTSCSTCRMEFESFAAIWQKMNDLPEEQPSADLSLKFQSMLAAYQQGWHESRNQFGFLEWFGQAFKKPVFQLGFSTMLLIIGFVIGLAFKSTTDKATVTDLAHQLDDMRELVMLSMLKQESSADRLQAVNYSYQVQKPRADIREALHYTLEHDPSTNVRLAALRALQPYARDPQVRQRIIESFHQQQSPLVQVEIVDFIRSTETRQMELLQLLDEDDNINDAVRQHIKWSSGTVQNSPLLKEIKK